MKSFLYGICKFPLRREYSKTYQLLPVSQSVFKNKHISLKYISNKLEGEW